MSLHSLIKELKRDQIKIWTDGERLSYRTTRGPLSNDLRERIKPHKQELIKYLLEIDGCAESVPTFARANRNETLPVSYAEERFWFIDSMNPDSAVFQYFSAYKLPEEFDEVVFRKCVETVVDNHEILRTRYLYSQDSVIRKIEDLSNSEIKEIAVVGNDESARDKSLLDALSSEQSRKLNLSVDGCFQTKLYKNGEKSLAVSIKLHHITYDDQSLSILWRELSDAYCDLLEGRVSKDKKQDIQYADFAYWQRNQKKTVLVPGLSYWEDLLNDAPKLIDLPLDRKRQEVSGNIGKYLTVKIDSTTMERVDNLCNMSDTTRFMLLMTVFSLLLHRYTHQSSVLVGTPVSNRKSDALYGVMGCFIDTLVLRTDFESGQSFYDLLKSTKKTVLNAFEHQSVPFEKIVKALNPDRSSSAHPVFQVMLNYITDIDDRVKFNLPGCSTERFQFNEELIADFDIKLTVTEKRASLSCNFLYNSHLFTDATMRGFADHFKALLNSALENPELPIANLNYLALDERENILHQWNETSCHYAENDSVIDMFDKQAADTPDRVAIVHKDFSLSYKELYLRKNQLAHCLQRYNIGEHSVVGVFLHRSVEVSVSLLAVFGINAVYLPLDASYPIKRLKRMIRLSNASCVVTTTNLKEKLDGSGITIVCIDKDIQDIESDLVHKPAKKARVNDLAYMIFTSGSTGSPKGVCVPHRQILNRLQWMWSEHPFEESDVSCQKTAISFVDSLWELLGPLLKGSSSILLDDETTRDPILFLQALDVGRVSRLWVVPAQLQLLIDTSGRSGLIPGSLRFIVTSGEPLSWGLAGIVQKTWPRVELYNLYGTSEAWDVSWYHCPKPDESSRLLSSVSLPFVPIGKPINNTSCYILDKNMQPVAVGVSGELYVGGHGLAASFIESTPSEKQGVIANPWKDHQLILATGDIAKYRENGDIVFIGRDDGFVNLRGYRVDPSEIEQYLSDMKEFENVAVVHTPNELDGGQLVAFVTATDSRRGLKSKPDSNYIRQYLGQRLPQFMLPNQYVYLQELPLTPSGKIDKFTLAQEFINNESINTKILKSPRTDLENKIFNIWAEVLGNVDFGTDDNFFSVGGHSLLAVSLFEKLNGTFDQSLKLSSLFEAATISDQAELIARDAPSSAVISSLVQISKGSNSAPLFLVPPAAGTGLNFRNMPQSVSDTQSIYTFNLEIHYEERDENESLAILAKKFIREIVAVQSDSPYFIGGMCFGGVVALEMARQLSELDKKVGGLVLIDAVLPFIGPTWQKKIRTPTYPRQAMAVLRDVLIHRFSKQSLKRLYNRLVREIFQRWQDPWRQYRILNRYHNSLLRTHEAGACDVDAYMLCSREYSEKDGYLERWGSLITGRLDIDILGNATHLEMLVDNKDDMALIGRKIQEYLDNYNHAAREKDFPVEKLS